MASGALFSVRTLRPATALPAPAGSAFRELRFSQYPALRPPSPRSVWASLELTALARFCHAARRNRWQAARQQLRHALCISRPSAIASDSSFLGSGGTAERHTCPPRNTAAALRAACRIRRLMRHVALPYPPSLNITESYVPQPWQVQWPPISYRGAACRSASLFLSFSRPPRPGEWGPACLRFGLRLLRPPSPISLGVRPPSCAGSSVASFSQARAAFHSPRRGKRFCTKGFSPPHPFKPRGPHSPALPGEPAQNPAPASGRFRRISAGLAFPSAPLGLPDYKAPYL
jgi:hypothetical protein